MIGTRGLPAPLACVVLAGCAGALPVVDYYESDSETLRRYVAMQITEDQTGFREIEPVRGLYCNRNVGDAGVGSATARAQAIDQVKLKAAKLRADAVTGPNCSINETGDIANNCWATVICEAVALRRDPI